MRSAAGTGSAHMEYPAAGSGRDTWILGRRGSRNALNPLRPYSFLFEQELAGGGRLIPCITVFLTNRECPWRCVMCDLWRNTLEEGVPAGAIPAQIQYALERLGGGKEPGGPRQLKLYNSGSFFDPAAIPVEDYGAIARQVCGFECVIVECHPRLVGGRVDEFARELARAAGEAGVSVPRLEVAMGLETADPLVLEKLNKRMTLDDFRLAARWLREAGHAVRAFVLVQPPFCDVTRAAEGAESAAAFAFDCGAEVVSLIPVRNGNGAMEALEGEGMFSEPDLATVERALALALELRRGRVFLDLWDLRRFSRCPECFEERARRLREMNWSQGLLPPATCVACGGLG